MINDWLSSEQGKVIVAAIAGFLCATLLGWLKAYSGEKGKIFAITQDIQKLQQQLEENTKITTKATKSIEQSYSREDVLWRSELDFRERQLSELYGPAYGIVKSEKHIYDLWMDGKMADVNLKVKEHFHEHNKIMRDLIINKANLIDGATMPDCFVRYITNSIVFDLYAVPTECGEVPQHLKDDPRVTYPFDFDDHIIKTTERLKARIETLHRNLKWTPDLGPEA
jgi:hypothetical protein